MRNLYLTIACSLVSVGLTAAFFKLREPCPEGFGPGHFVKDDKGTVRTWTYHWNGQRCIVFTATTEVGPNIPSMQVDCH